MSGPAERQVALPVEPDDHDAAADSAATNGLGTIARLADDVLPTLIARVGASALGELEVRQNGWKIRLRRRAPVADDEPKSSPRARTADRRPERPDGSRSGTEPDRDGAEAAPVQKEPERRLVTAPAVGYYLPRDELAVGLAVRGGDLLGHVDVLGVRVDVVVGADGRVARLLAEPGEAVEYGQPLARLETESRD